MGKLSDAKFQYIADLLHAKIDEGGLNNRIPGMFKTLNTVGTDGRRVHSLFGPFELGDYGIIWRLWPKEPTDQQRRDAPWS